MKQKSALPAAPSGKPTKRRILRVIIGLAILPLLAASFMAWRWANQPVEQTISVGTSQIDSLPDFKAVTTTLYSFEVPVNFKVRSATDPSNTLLIHTQAIEATTTGRQVGVTTNSLPASGLAGVADYNLRATMTEQYVRYQPDDLPAGVVAFRNVQGGELTAFYVQANRYASITVSGISGNGRLRALFQQVTTTWQWL